jgi:hypothetical protein
MVPVGGVVSTACAADCGNPASARHNAISTHPRNHDILFIALAP